MYTHIMRHVHKHGGDSYLFQSAEYSHPEVNAPLDDKGRNPFITKVLELFGLEYEYNYDPDREWLEWEWHQETRTLK